MELNLLTVLMQSSVAGLAQILSQKTIYGHKLIDTPVAKPSPLLDEVLIWF